MKHLVFSFMLITSIDLLAQKPILPDRDALLDC